MRTFTLFRYPSEFYSNRLTQMTLIYLLQWLASLSFTFPQVPTDRWLVELRSGDAACLEEWRQTNHLNQPQWVFKALPVDHWYVIETPANYSNELGQLPCVNRVLPDEKIDWRDTRPNDANYINQGDMELINMPNAWDISTGGITAQGDTIAVAIIDEGFQTSHPDLMPNIWHNRNEIKDDGIDNDNNGYKDDFEGYNIKTQNDHHPVNTHGTSVAGVIGAKGNNSIGVSGINWNVKLVLISGAEFESELIESYQYALDLRKKYDETAGTEGAFIVATNLSAGINNAFAVDHPLWCDMYNKLGERGILSVCAAPNVGVSVDEVGDMPTTCTSPYMIAVTNVDLSDNLLENAGYGPVSVDIGAPGHGTITTATTSQYKEFQGTSSATPHVTGLVALMYSTPCESFLAHIHDDPQSVAARIRDIIFSTGKINNSLQEITVTGKRIQASEAMRATVTDCGPISDNTLDLTYIRPNPARLESVKVGFSVVGDTAHAHIKLYTVTGAELADFPISQGEFEQGYMWLDVSPLPAATYLLTLWNGKKKSTRKLVVY